MGREQLISKTLLLDLETTRTGRLRHLGAVLGGTVINKQHGPFRRVLEQLDGLAKAADFILGHNLLGHDFPILKAVYPTLLVLTRPVIDTLYLSPLAFPQNPYHRLVKDYKLVRATLNDPLADARLAASVFDDQLTQFADVFKTQSRRIDFFHTCFAGATFNGFSGQGLASVFCALGATGFKSDAAAHEWFVKKTDGLACRLAASRLADVFTDPARRPIMAYCLAWLTVAGSNSVLPPWVRHRFPEISSILNQLRDEACSDPDCAYCRENHDPDRHLKRFFGFPDFRQKPTTDEGKSLQREIVKAGMADRPLLAILPTGGGKSLCYQLPALVRHWRRGLLTIVISPLQALMKDQVDNLVKNTGTPFADAVYGLLTPIERGAVLERVRLGDTAILYLAPEQLRSRSVRSVLRQREIGCWVFDEAHCLSKWGHDFRPDYLYAARFIREFSTENNQALAPVCGFTATAKLDVIEELTAHFRDALDQALVLFEGGVGRDNLIFEVLPVAAPNKYEQTLRLVGEALAEDETASVVIYAATRRRTEEIRDFLSHQGVAVDAFHGGLEAKQKRDVIEAFTNGDVPVISATNAFGMGVDKENIRLVLHVDMPGSLENYIQEAGRAGRDRQPARCILLYDPADADFQFTLGALSEVKAREIQRILRALRRAKRNAAGEIVVTSDELLRDGPVGEKSAPNPDIRDTRVKTAISWLERAGFLQRNQNLTDIFQGRPLVTSLDEARSRMASLNLSSATTGLWLGILRLIFNAPADHGFSADAIAEGLFPDAGLLKKMETTTGMTPAQIIIQALHDMADARLLDRGLMLSAILRPKGKNNAASRLQRMIDVEIRLLDLLRAEDPDADDGRWVSLSVRRLCQRLRNEDVQTTTIGVQSLIRGLSYDGQGLAAAMGSIALRHMSRDRYDVRLQRSWDAIVKTVNLRHNVAHTILQELLRLTGEKQSKTALSEGDVNIAFSSNDLAAAMSRDIALTATVKKVLPAIDRALMFLHEHKVIHLQGGMAVFRQAMTIRMSPKAKGRRYTQGDFKPLAVHYRERRFQVHVMVEYAVLALDKIASALTLVLDYFSMGRVRFLNRYFAGRKELVEKATTAEAYRRIVERLGNPVQIDVVGRPVDDNLLVLAGPGAGKTTLIVHRCAYLLQVQRIPARQILVLCFNHNAAVTLRKRLFALIGSQVRGVTVVTYHGAAMRLAGISVRALVETGDRNGTAVPIDFDGIIQTALGLLKGETGIPEGDETDFLRDQLLGGYSHILVDEYQDIDPAQYELVAAIAGRTLDEADGRLSILAVGDDDQNIYAFRGTNVRFIRRFQADYKATPTYLVENYRSSRHIINAANQLIKHNHDRMKGGYPVCIDRAREHVEPGGRWARLDPVAQGRVQRITVSDPLHQAASVLAEIERLRSLDPDFRANHCAILARTRAMLPPLRWLLEKNAYPVKRILSKSFPIHRVREVATLIDRLRAPETATIRASELIDGLQAADGGKPASLWQRLLIGFLENDLAQTGDALMPAGYFLDTLFDFLAEQRREKTIGEGVFLGTLHAAKGMAFVHVFILDGDWGRPRTIDEWEAERRLLYVGMTRARQTLTLMRMQPQPNLLLAELAGQHMLPRKGAGPFALDDQIDFHGYEMLGLDDVFMDYAGTFAPTHPIHRHLSDLETGDTVWLVPDKRGIAICDRTHFRLGRLSADAARRWGQRLDTIETVRVLAMLTREQVDPDPSYRRQIKTHRWELPVLEVVLRHKG